MRLFVVPTTLALLALALPSSALHAAPADLVSVSAHTSFPTASPGGADEGTCFVANDSAGAVRVRLDLRVVYSDGTVQRLRGISDPGVLGPGDAYELSVFFVVPGDASLGTAQFVCDVTAQGRGLREVEVQSATFDVVSALAWPGAFPL
jgi:hypothetical protein